MKNDADRITYRMKNNKNNSKKDEDSNSSRESIEMEIRSFTKNKKFSRRKTQEGEQIKFFFNDLPPEPPEKKNNNYKIDDYKKRKSNLKIKVDNNFENYNSNPKKWIIKNKN